MINRIEGWRQLASQLQTSGLLYFYLKHATGLKKCLTRGEGAEKCSAFVIFQACRDWSNSLANINEKVRIQSEKERVNSSTRFRL